MLCRRTLPQCLNATRRCYSISSKDGKPRRSYLYVPSSSERMLQKSLETPSDVIIYDLEDSVAQAQKTTARESLSKFLTTGHSKPLPESNRIAVRLNALHTPFFEEDIRAAVQIPSVDTLVLPKINSPQDLDVVSKYITHATAWSSSSAASRKHPLRIVASIESATALFHVGDIAKWKSKNREEAGGALTALLFAAEDYCADTSIIRTKSRLELLYTRSQVVIAAKAFGLDAIDMVCVNYKDPAYLRDECEDGRRLGFDGKQAIHPSQVDIIHETFMPTEQEILRAAKIVHMMEISHQSRKGAFGLETHDGKGGKEMIDAPMLKQAQNTLRLAKAVGATITKVD
ncbi:citrate lyase beta subunit [Schizopora paradoxa]|uniref:Citrate lyase beta subunit n=1 Tax=Schizopora paradoxa TaxID=27342 RepID=A0A0H2S071_9AGAM|nr:citrate lyase beta subunit [Schizopora paradoxa]